MPSRRRRTNRPAIAIETGWRWRAFPVLFAFVAGVFLMGLASRLGEWVFGAIFLVSLVGLSFGLAHILTRQIALRRARRLHSRSEAHDEAPEDEEIEEDEAPPMHPPHRRRRRRR